MRRWFPLAASSRTDFKCILFFFFFSSPHTPISTAALPPVSNWLIHSACLAMIMARFMEKKNNHHVLLTVSPSLTEGACSSAADKLSALPTWLQTHKHWIRINCEWWLQWGDGSWDTVVCVCDVKFGKSRLSENYTQLSQNLISSSSSSFKLSCMGMVVTFS